MSPGPLLENSNLLHSHGEFTKICLQPPPGKVFCQTLPSFGKKNLVKRIRKKILNTIQFADQTLFQIPNYSRKLEIHANYENYKLNF